jgi:anthranilate/para-aminobenzoate synthase component II
VKITLIDFDDSFTYNLVQELEAVGPDVTVIHWTDFEVLPSDGILALGPGPGHPDDYQRIFPLLRDWLRKGHPYFGVCLGHQIFWRLQGEEVVRSRTPLHGQKVELILNEEWQAWLGVRLNSIKVQRYNSLAVFETSRIDPLLKTLIQDHEILITRGLRVLTYQFHPESVGTSYRHLFFEPLVRDLIY